MMASSNVTGRSSGDKAIFVSPQHDSTHNSQGMLIRNPHHFLKGPSLQGHHRESCQCFKNVVVQFHVAISVSYPFGAAAYNYFPGLIKISVTDTIKLFLFLS